MEIPWRCADCSHENMIDLEGLTEWQVDKLITAQGFTCEKCGKRQAVYAESISLREAEKKLFRYSPAHAKFQFHFAKILRKVRGILETMTN